MSNSGIHVRAVLLAASLTAACGPSGDAEPPVGPPTGIATSDAAGPAVNPSSDGPADLVACDLLSEGEIAAALGSPTTTVPGTGSLLCDWEADRDDIFSIRLWLLDVHARSVFETEREQRADKIEPLSGVGDDAFVNIRGANVSVLVGSVYFFFQIVEDCGGLGADPCPDGLLEELKDAAVELAGLVASRL